MSSCRQRQHFCDYEYDYYYYDYYGDDDDHLIIINAYLNPRSTFSKPTKISVLNNHYKNSFVKCLIHSCNSKCVKIIVFRTLFFP